MQLIEYNDNDLITFLDSDDYLGEDYINDCVRKFEINKSDILCTRRTVEFGGTASIVNSYDAKLIDTVVSGFEATYNLVAGKISTVVWGKLYVSDLFKEEKFLENVFVGEDTALLYKIFEKTNRVYMSSISSIYVNRDRNIDSLTRSRWSNRKCLSVFRGDRYRLEHPVTKFYNDENEKINKIINYDCFGNFLEIYPRIDASQLSEDEKNEVKEYRKYINSIKLINTFHPKSTKEKVKKAAYICLGKLYQKLYKFFLKN